MILDNGWSNIQTGSSGTCHHVPSGILIVDRLKMVSTMLLLNTVECWTHIPQCAPYILLCVAKSDECMRAGRVEILSPLPAFAGWYDSIRNIVFIFALAAYIRNTGLYPKCPTNPWQAE